MASGGASTWDELCSGCPLAAGTWSPPRGAHTLSRPLTSYNRSSGTVEVASRAVEQTDRKARSGTPCCQKFTWCSSPVTNEPHRSLATGWVARSEPARLQAGCLLVSLRHVLSLTHGINTTDPIAYVALTVGDSTKGVATLVALVVARGLTACAAPDIASLLIVSLDQLHMGGAEGLADLCAVVDGHISLDGITTVSASAAVVTRASAMVAVGAARVVDTLGGTEYIASAEERE